MRICYLIHVFPPESWGGSENYVYMLAQQLRGRHEIRIFTRTHRPDQGEYELLGENVEGVEVFRLNNNFLDVDRFERVYRNPRVDEVFGRFLDEWRPDVIHAHHLTCLSTDLVKVAHQRSIPFILTIHDFWMMCLRGQRFHPSLKLCEDIIPQVCGQCVQPWMDGAHRKAIAERFGGNGGQQTLLHRLQRRVYEWWKRPDPTREIEAFHRHSRAVLQGVDLLIITSAFVRDKFLEFGCDPKRMILSDNGIDPTLVEHVHYAPTEKIRFGFVATLIPSKGAHLLIDAFKRLPQEKAELKIFGSPPEYEEYTNYFEELQRNASGAVIKFMGKFPIEDIGKVFSQMDVLVVPSLWFENAPLIIRQALLAKIPVITANRGGMAESVSHEVNGLHFEIGNAESLAQAMRRVIEDPSLRSRLALGERKVKTIADNALELERIYERLWLRRSN